MAAAPMISPGPMPPRIPYRRGAGSCRIWASWRARSPGGVLMPTKKPHGTELTLEHQRAHQALTQRRLRIEHVHSSVKRCRMVKDCIRLWKVGVRARMLARCCVLQNFRVRLIPWRPMV